MVFDGLGMPCTSERRPMKFDGPTFLQREALTSAESRVWAGNDAASDKAARDKNTRDLCICSPASCMGTARQYCNEGRSDSVGVAWGEGRVAVGVSARHPERRREAPKSRDPRP